MANLFTSTCQNLSDFTEGVQQGSSGESVACVANAGKTGAGDYGLVVTFNGTVNEEVGVRVGSTAGTGRSFSFDLYVPSATTLTAFSPICHSWYGTSTYAGDLLQLGLGLPRSVSGNQSSSTYFRLGFQNTANYGQIDYSDINLTKDAWHHVEVRMSDDQIAVYIDVAAPYSGFSIYSRLDYSGKQFRGFSLGKWAYGATGSFPLSGTLKFDNVSLDTVTVPSLQGTALGAIGDVWATLKSHHVRSDGAYVRHAGYPYPDGNYGYNGEGAGSDIVSEGQAYGMLFAVQQNDQTTFNLLETFRFTKMCRVNSAVCSTARNNGTIGGQTTAYAPNLSGWFLESDSGIMYDANPATDAENDFMTALYWAHARWGSGGSINYLSRANAMAHDLKQYTFTQVVKSGVTYQLQSADAINGLAEMNPSYLSPVAFRLAKQYDTTNATFWQQAIDGCYLALNSLAALTAYHGPSEWMKWNTGTGAADWDAGRDGVDGRGWSYNAFRSPYRIYWDYQFYNEPKALSLLTNAFRTFSTTEYNTQGFFVMEKAPDGSPLTTANGGYAATPYEKTGNSYAQYITQKLGTPTSIASNVFTAKIAYTNIYTSTGNGAIFRDNPNPTGTGIGLDSYFGLAWATFAMMTEYGGWINFGNTTVTTRTTTLTMGAQINTSSKSTYTKAITMGATIKKTLTFTLTMGAQISFAASPRRQSVVTLSASIAFNYTTSLGLSSYINAAPVGTQVSNILIPSNPSKKVDLIAFMQAITGNKEPDSQVLFGLYLNLSQKDVENEFPNHPSLQASNQLSLVPGQDLSYGFVQDFRKERYLRIVGPVAFSHPLTFIEYTQLRDALVSDTALQTFGLPMKWYWAPENPLQIHVWPVPDQAYLVQYDYIRYASDLVNDNDVPFFDRLYHVILCYRALFYYYCSDGIARPDKGAMWNGMYEVGLKKLRIDEQKRQLQTVRFRYGTGVNEGLSNRGFIA